MLAFQRFLQQQAAAAAGEPDHDDQLVEQLVQRVAEAVLLGDRREALQQLRDLLTGSGGPRAQHAFGTVGFPVVLQVARDRADGDLEMMQLALESLAAAVGGGDTGGAAGEAAAINAQQLARMPEAVPLLLSLLEQEPAGLADFYARYHALQVVKGLAAAAPRQLQEAILGAPLGMTRLMDLLAEQEVLRNEALLLLTQLAAGSADLQKIAVFEGAFDRLFSIIREEGLLDGDIVVQDCFQLMAALLRGSPPNQLMFRETGFLAQLPTLLKLPAEGSGAARDGPIGHGSAELAPQKAANLVAALDVVLALLPPAAGDPAAPVNASAAENRQALLQRGLLGVLEGLALREGGAPDSGVRAQALLCLAALVCGSQVQQDQLAALSLPGPGGQPPQPLLQAALHAAIDGAGLAEQLAADRLLESYCAGNQAGQSVLAGSLLHGAGAAPGSFGGVLLLALGRQGGLGELAASARAAAALSHLVAGNPSIQPHLLAVQVTVAASAAAGAPAGSPQSTSLIALCASRLGLLATQHGRQLASAAAAADMLRLLLLWLHACPPAVTAFLRAVAQSQPFLVDSIRGSNACSGAAASSHPLTRGMLALLLGLCASYAEDGAGTPTQPQLLGAISSQIGQEQYLGILDALQQYTADVLRDAAGGSSSHALFAEGPSASPAFAAFLGRLVSEVRQRVTHGQAPAVPSMPTAPAAGGTALHPPPLPRQATLPPAAQTPAGFNPPPPPYGGHASHGMHPAAPHPPPAWVPPKPASPSGAHPPTVFHPRVPSSAGQSSASGSPRSTPPPGPSHLAPKPAAPALPVPLPYGAPANGTAAGPSAEEVQQLQAALDALQRENQQLIAQHSALAAQLQMNGSNRADAAHAAAEAAAAAADATAARQQLAAVQAAAAEAEAAAERARADAQAAQIAARKLETDLEDLSAAYSTLDAHAGTLQAQVERLQDELQAARQQAAAAAAAGAGQQQGAGGGGGRLSEEEVEQRVEAARQEAAQEADEAMGDLLVCLGQEEAKVARLRDRLEAFGVDCDALLADIVAAGEAGAADNDDDLL